MKMLGLKVKEGQIGEIDSYEHYQIALNETAMKTLGYDTLEKAAVRSVSPLWIAMVQGKVVEYGTSMMQVNAVVKDFFPQRLTDGVPPMLLVISSNSLGAALIKAVPGREKELVPYLKKIEQEVYHTDDFTYQWMDDKVAEMYKDDERTSDIYTLFSYMAIWVSCLGLLGISLFEIRRRYREIAIRKVNGATRRDLYLLLVRRYLLVQLLAFVGTQVSFGSVACFCGSGSCGLADDSALHCHFCGKSSSHCRLVPDTLPGGNGIVSPHAVLADEQGLPHQPE